MSAQEVAGPLVPGEYDQVARASSDLDALKRAHSTPITRKDAEKMLRLLTREHLSSSDTLTIRWGARRGVGGWKAKTAMVPVFTLDGTPARTMKWDRETQTYIAGKPRKRKQYLRDENGRCIMTPYIALPSVAMSPGGPWHNGQHSFLRVGLVLHEFAHVLTAPFCRFNPHGQMFTDCLDSLVAAWVSARGAASIAA